MSWQAPFASSVGGCSPQSPSMSRATSAGDAGEAAAQGQAEFLAQRPEFLLLHLDSLLGEGAPLPPGPPSLPRPAAPRAISSRPPAAVDQRGKLARLSTRFRRPGEPWSACRRSRSGLELAGGTNKYLRTAGQQFAFHRGPNDNSHRSLRAGHQAHQVGREGPLGSTWATPRCHCSSRFSGPLPASPVKAISPVPHTTPQFRNGSGSEKLNRGIGVGWRSSRLATTDLFAAATTGEES